MCALVAWIFVAGSIHAAPTAAVEETQPSILVLFVASDSPGVAREGRFVRELGMALNGMTVEVVHLENTGFDVLPLAQQIEEVRRLLDRHEAVAVTWINVASRELLLLHLVAVSTGRALVRLVETELRQDSEAILAMAARELLGTAFLFEQPKSGPIEEAVESVRLGAGMQEDTSTEQRASLSLTSRASGGIAGFSGQSMELGGGMALGYRLVAGLHGRAYLGATGGPLGNSQTDEKLQGWSLIPGIQFAYVWRVSQVGIGPLISVEVPWLHLDIADDETNYQFAHWNLRAALNLELSWYIGRVVALTFQGGLGASPRQLDFRRASTRQRVLATPFLSWNLGLGISFVLD